MESSHKSIIHRIEFRADSVETTASKLIFLHGMLIGDGVERSAFQCAPLMRETVFLGRIEIVMPEFDSLFKVSAREPADLSPGPVSRPLIEEFKRLTDSETKVTVLAYSYGAVILAKLLRTTLAQRVRSIGLIAPVVTWIRDSWIDPLSMLPVFTISGTHDKYAKDEDVLRRWFPKGQFCSINGGNHLNYLMPSPMDRYDTRSGLISRSEQVSRTAQNLIAYLGIPLRSGAPKHFQIVEVTPEGEQDLTGEFREKMRRASGAEPMRDY